MLTPKPHPFLHCYERIPVLFVCPSVLFVITCWAMIYCECHVSKCWPWNGDQPILANMKYCLRSRLSSNINSTCTYRNLCLLTNDGIHSCHLWCLHLQARDLNSHAFRLQLTLALWPSHAIPSTQSQCGGMTWRQGRAHAHSDWCTFNTLHVYCPLYLLSNCKHYSMPTVWTT